MKETFNDIRQFLFTCSGEDNFILKRCSRRIQMRFALLGSFVLLIFIGCFLSASFFTYSLFDGKARLMSIPAGIIWGAIVVNMYLLLLYTISPAIIPLSSKKKKRIKNQIEETKVEIKFLTLSMTFRMGFMVLLAIIIAQPLNVVLLSSSVENSIQTHKIVERAKLYILANKDLIKRELLDQKEINNKIVSRFDSASGRLVLKHIQIINDKVYGDSIFIDNVEKKLKQLKLFERNAFLNQKEKEDRNRVLVDLDLLLVKELQSDSGFVENINSISIDGDIKKDFDNFKSDLAALVIEKIENYNALNALLNKSEFYVKTIQLLLAENPLSWLLTLFVCMLFLLPIYFKYKVRDLSATIFVKREKNEPEIVRLREELINTTNFEWLARKIKSIDVKEIRTSDYYFQRMLIEHKIILEEYYQSKNKFSKILTKNIKEYNSSSLKKLKPLLDKLKEVNPAKYNEISKQIFEEYLDQEMIKYEYWLDCPFRTRLRHAPSVKNNEQEFLDFIYNQQV